METGILGEWYKAEGSSFSAGEAIAKIETDKASIDFEAQDDGYIAKILMEAGTGKDIPVGTPIMISVEEEEHVAAFASFQLPTTTTPPPPAAAAAPVAPPAPVVPPPPPVVAATPTSLPPKVEVVAPPPPPPPAAAVVILPEPTTLHDAMVTAVAPVLSTGWGQFAKMNSPLIKTLSKGQKEYIQHYGTTGQIPL